MEQVTEAYAHALAPGTRANRMSQAKTFISFMLAIKSRVFEPDVTDILMYIQLLKNSSKTLGTIKNYISGAKGFLVERGHDSANFTHPMVVTFMKGVERHSGHVPQGAVAIPTKAIIQACVCLRRASVEGEVVAACVLFGFATMLRQCHLVYTPHGHMHMLHRSDITINKDMLLVTVRSSKTTSRRNVAVIPVHRASEPRACPVHAYERAIGLVQGPKHACLFLAPGSGRPLSAPRVNTMFRQALAAVGFKGALSASLHSLRRSGAHACIRAGLPIDQVKKHGLWKSDAVKTYLPKEISTTPRALKDALEGDA